MRIFSSLLLLCLLSTEAFAADSDLIAASRVAVDKRDFETAAALLEKAVAANPKSAEARYLLGSVYGSQARRAGILKQASLAKKVKAEFEAVLALDPNHINARQGLVDFYSIAPGFMGGSTEKALAHAAEIKKRDPVKGRHAYARIYARARQIDLARKEIVEAVREQPKSARAHQGLGMLMLNNDKNYTGALHEFEMALKLDPGYMPAYLRIGHLAAVTGNDFARAEAFLKKYLAYKPAEDEPPPAVAWYWLGMLYEKHGRKGDAKQSFTNALRLEPEDKNVKEALKRVS